MYHSVFGEIYCPLGLVGKGSFSMSGGGSETKIKPLRIELRFMTIASLFVMDVCAKTCQKAIWVVAIQIVQLEPNPFL
jgi:hypothetical protein